MENQENNKLASRISRLIAVIIDGIIVSVIAYIIASIFGYNIFALSGVFAYLISALLWFGLFLGINYKLLKSNGQTVGKKLLKIKIANLDNSVPEINNLILKRILAFGVLAYIPFLNLISIVNGLMIFRSDKRCLHDLFAETHVIEA